MHRRASSHEVSDPQAQSNRQSHHSRVCLPGSRCALALIMRLGAFLPDRPPWYPFNQARPRGPLPFRACPNRGRLRLSALTAPLAIGHAGPKVHLKYGSRCVGLAPAAVSLQGLSLWRLGWTRWIFSALHPPWLSWVSPPWGSPLPCCGLSARAADPTRSPPTVPVSQPRALQRLGVRSFGRPLSTSGRP